MLEGVLLKATAGGSDRGHRRLHASTRTSICWFWVWYWGRWLASNVML